MDSIHTTIHTMCWYILQYMPINTSLFWHVLRWYVVNWFVWTNDMCKSKTKIEKCCTCLSPVQGSGLCQCPTCWDFCLLYQLVILAPFSTACKAGWIHAILEVNVILGVNVTTWLSLGLEELCSASILGPCLSLWPSCRLKIQKQSNYCCFNSKYCIECGLKCSMAPIGMFTNNLWSNTSINAVTC